MVLSLSLSSSFTTDYFAPSIVTGSGVAKGYHNEMCRPPVLSPAGRSRLTAVVLDVALMKGGGWRRAPPIFPLPLLPSPPALLSSLLISYEVVPDNLNHVELIPIHARRAPRTCEDAGARQRAPSATGTGHHHPLFVSGEREVMLHVRSCVMDFLFLIRSPELFSQKREKSKKKRLKD